jgi:hypothetical protein
VVAGSVYDLTGYKESMGCVSCKRFNDHYARILLVCSLSGVCLPYLAVPQPTRGVGSVCLFVCLSVNKYSGGACKNISFQNQLQAEKIRFNIRNVLKGPFLFLGAGKWGGSKQK